MIKKQWLSALIVALGLSVSAQASTVVTFEDISPNDLADGYSSISGWTSLASPGIYDADFGGIGRQSFYGNQGFLSFDQAPVIFQGTYYKAYHVLQDEFPLAAIELWYQGTLVHSIQYLRSTAGLEWLASDYSGLVDQIYLRGGIEGFSIDNLTFTPTSTVPLPAAWLMFTGGAALLGFARRRMD